MEYIKIVGDEVNNYIFPDKYKNKYGIWLIGYDGQVSFLDIQQISFVFKKNSSILIDKMPIRKTIVIHD